MSSEREDVPVNKNKEEVEKEKYILVIMQPTSESDREEDSSSQPRSCLRVNRKLLPVKMFYFTFLAGAGSLVPFIAVYMKELGLTSTETGILYGAMPFLCFFIRPFISAVADKWTKHRHVLMTCTLLTGVLHLSVVFVPGRPVALTRLHAASLWLHCGDHGSVLTSCGWESCDLHASVSHERSVFVCPGDNQALLEKDSSEHESVDGNSSSDCCSWESAEILHVEIRESSWFTEDVDSRDPSVYGKERISDSNTSSRNAENSAHTLGLWAVTRLYKQGEASSNSTHADAASNSTGDIDSEDTAPRKDVLQTGSCFIRCEIEDQVLELQVVDVSQLFTNPEEATNEPRLELPRTLRHVVSNPTAFSNTTCFANRTMACTLTCQNVPVPSVCPSSDQGDVAVDTTFVWMFVSFFLASAAFSPIYSLADAATFALLGKHRHMYGKQRLWGTVGLAISAVTCTFVINHLRDAGRAFSYDVMFYMFGGFCLLSTVIAYFMDMDVNVKGESLVKNVLKIVIVPEVAAFLVVVLYVGMLSGALQGFLFWYLADLGASPLLFGLCLAVNCLFEIPFFFISGSLINRFGTIACLSCTLLVLSARFMAYSLLSNAWHVLFIEWVHGLTFGVTWSAVTTHASSISPPGLTATTQGLVSGLNFGIGKGLGSLLTGALFSKIGARWTFRALSIACVCLVIVYVTLHRCVFHGKATLMPDGKDTACTTGATDTEQQAQNKSLLIPEKPGINC